MKYCEVVGRYLPDNYPEDKPTKCEHIGFIPKTGKNVCCKYGGEIKEADGYRVCSPLCKEPFIEIVMICSCDKINNSKVEHQHQQ